MTMNEPMLGGSRRMARPKRFGFRQTLAAGRIYSARGSSIKEGSPRRQRRGEVLRWLPEYTTFATLENRYDDE